MLTERELLAIGKELLDSDPERGVVLLNADRRAISPYVRSSRNSLWPL